MESIQPYLELLLRHVQAVVFFAFLVEAAGIPLPSRILLLVAATFAMTWEDVVYLVAASTAGALIGDHIPYLAGTLSGPRILAWYCRLTLGSTDCVNRTVGHFRRYGPAAILLCRFSASVRLFASALAGCGHIAYWKFLSLDFAGTVVYTAAWTTAGYIVGDQVSEMFARHKETRLLALLMPLALATLLAYRLWRRRRHGPANAAGIVAESSCVDARTSIDAKTRAS